MSTRRENVWFEHEIEAYFAGEGGLYLAEDVLVLLYDLYDTSKMQDGASTRSSYLGLSSKLTRKVGNNQR